jgi:hypothetical protein
MYHAFILAAVLTLGHRIHSEWTCRLESADVLDSYGDRSESNLYAKITAGTPAQPTWNR